MSQRIKVLHLIPSLGVGGAEQLLLHLAPRLDPRRFEVHICSLGEALGNGLRPEFERIELPILIIDSKHMYSLRMLIEVVSYARNHQIDIIHTHQSNADVIGLLAGRILGRPVISTMHSIPENYRYERLHSRWLTRLTTRYLASRFIAVSQSVPPSLSPSGTSRPTRSQRSITPCQSSATCRSPMACAGAPKATGW